MKRVEKRSISSLQQELSQLDRRIDTQQKKLSTMKKQRQQLQERVDKAKAFEILGILDQRNISFEDAAQILRSQNPVLDTGIEEDSHEIADN